VVIGLPNSRTARRWSVLLGVLCIALIVLGGTLQVAHTHRGGDLSHTDCSLCATAHVVAQAVSAPVALPASRVIASVRGFTLRPLRASHSTFALFTRPPPVASNLA
jgi:hypothetical protein